MDEKITANSPENAQALAKALERRQRKVGRVLPPQLLTFRQQRQIEEALDVVPIPKDILQRIRENKGHPIRAPGCE